MGQLFCTCFIQEPAYRRFSHIYPDSSIFFSIEPGTKNEDRFLQIPDKQNIDKTIESLDSNRIIDEKMLSQLQFAMIHLKKIKTQIKHFGSSDLTPLPSPNKKITIDTSPVRLNTETTMDSPAFRSSSTSVIESPLVRKFKENRGIRIIAEVQKANFMHPQELRKSNLSLPFVTIELRSSKPFESETRFSYSTTCHLDTLSPRWEECFEHIFPEEEAPKGWFVDFSLHYQYEGKKKTLRIGEPQSFAFESLFDQKVHTKTIEFKNKITRGTLAKVVVRFQLIHDVSDLQNRLIYEIDNRILKLQRLRECLVKQAKRASVNDLNDSLLVEDQSPFKIRAHMESQLFSDASVASDNDNNPSFYVT